MASNAIQVAKASVADDAPAASGTDKTGAIVSQAQLREYVAGLTVNDVAGVYVCRVGCVCGSLGKYTYNPAFLKDVLRESSRRKYSAREEEAMVRTVTRTFNKVKNDARLRIQDGGILYFEKNSRQYTVYIREAKLLQINKEKAEQ